MAAPLVRTGQDPDQMRAEWGRAKVRVVAQPLPQGVLNRSLNQGWSGELPGSNPSGNVVFVLRSNGCFVERDNYDIFGSISGRDY